MGQEPRLAIPTHARNGRRLERLEVSENVAHCFWHTLLDVRYMRYDLAAIRRLGHVALAIDE